MVENWWARFARWRYLPLLVLIIVPIFGHFASVFGLVASDPIGTYGSLSTQYTSGYLPGFSYADPNVGFTSEALGHLAALDWVHGQIPWWNPYEGIGFPLAGEMQSAALFPFTLLLLWQDGQLLFHLVLAMIAGLCSYAFFRRIGFLTIVALAGAIAFEFCGAYAWMGHAPYNPIAFLPMMLWGIELVLSREGGIWRGWFWLALGLSLSLYAGFPETAFLDGLFLVGWTVVRLFDPHVVTKRLAIARIVMGGIVGLFLSAPILIAFVDFLRVGYVGIHGGAVANSSLPSASLGMMVLPYLFGPITAYSSFDSTGTVSAIWANIGGYAGEVLMVLAILGLLARKHLSKRVFLAVFVAMSLGKSYGVPVVTTLVNLIPGIKNIAFYRYAPASWEYALILLALYGIETIAVLTKRALHWRVAIAVLVLCGFLVFSLSLWLSMLSHHSFQKFSIFYVGIEGVLLGILLVTLLRQNQRFRTLVLALLLVVDAGVNFMLPTFSDPTSYHVDQAAISFLQRHIGLQRFYTLGPFAPNYGSYFQIASINHNDLPVPKLWVSYLLHHLDGNASPILFIGTYSVQPSGLLPLAAFEQNFTAYQQLGVRYVIVPTSDASIKNQTIQYGQPVAGNQPYLFRSQDHFSGTVPVNQAGEIHSFSLFIGTYQGRASGQLYLTLKDGSMIAHGKASLKGAMDNAYFSIPLSTVFHVRKGSTLHFSIQKSSGNPVALWIWPQSSSQQENLLYNHQRLLHKIVLLSLNMRSHLAQSLRRVYRDSLMTMYRLSGALPFYSLRGTGDHVLSISLSSVHLVTRAKTLLLRRELFFPGWQAVVNGQTEPIVQVDQVFQGVWVPQGNDIVKFYYLPPAMNIGYVAFVLGILCLFILWLRTRTPIRRGRFNG